MLTYTMPRGTHNELCQIVLNSITMFYGEIFPVGIPVIGRISINVDDGKVKEFTFTFEEKEE